MATEFERIARIAGRTARTTGSVRLGIGDDAALLHGVPGFDTVVSTDLLVEGVHFQVDWTTPELLGRKAVAVALSDLAAMGALPRAVFLSLAVPDRLDDEYFDAFYTGAVGYAHRFGATIAGGDLSSSPGPLVIDAVVTGEVEENRALRRSGAQPGDLLFVSGGLGSATAGLRQLLAGTRLDTATTGMDLDAIRTLLAPTPRVELGRALVLTGAATAAIDLSDGLSSDLRHVCRASSVGAIVEASLLPTQHSLEDALHGGEQYELLFACPPVLVDRIALVSHQLKLDLTRIGRFEGAAEDVLLQVGDERRPLEPRGFEHFRR